MAGRRTGRQTSRARSSGRSTTTSAFWDFSLRVYAQPEVAAACLGLQERHGLDVNLLLLGCWLGAHAQGRLPEPVWRDLCAQVAVWQTQVVAPLRQVRQRLKGMLPAGVSNANDPLTLLRRTVSECELDAEHLEQLMLERAVAMCALETPVDCDRPDERGCAAAAANLKAYLAAAGVDAGGEQRTLTALIAGVFEQVSAERIAALLACGVQA
jgi:uncharacterized protein (TIGR02444 family)